MEIDKNIHGSGARERRTVIVQTRITPTDLQKVRVLMQNNGYHSLSTLLRDLLLEQKLVKNYETVTMTGRMLRDKMNIALYNLNKIGVNYNQVVATYQKQAKMLSRDGSPYLDTDSTEKKMRSLMKMTEKLRDEVAVMIDLLAKYMQDIDNH